MVSTGAWNAKHFGREHLHRRSIYCTWPKILDQRNLGATHIAGLHVVFVHEGPGEIDTAAGASEQFLRRQRIR